MDPLFGTDLSIVPNMVAYDASALDLTTKVRVLRRVRPGEPDTISDFATLQGRENVAQAPIRLETAGQL